MMNLVWPHIGWARLDKKDFGIITKVNVILPLISHILVSFIPVMLITYYGAGAVTDFKTALPMDSWYMKSLFTIGSLLP
ncbi:PTS sugar transporter subunit IIC, partial [Anaerostipes caccae]|uniref:PTS sugar transporter subunit IIC n=1 Tax=Anaerostipes caccae TaxID=105841 RepID=UPI001D0675CD